MNSAQRKRTLTFICFLLCLLNAIPGNHDARLPTHSDAVAIFFAQHCAEAKTCAPSYARNQLKQAFDVWQRAIGNGLSVALKTCRETRLMHFSPGFVGIQ